jgi:pantoate--beta-alanine ligase
MADPIVIDSASQMTAKMKEYQKAGKSIGFVPTMGALHAGHKSLLVRAREENDIVVASIYVNPTQFGPEEDFEKYPRTFDADQKICAEAGVDVIFAPENLYSGRSRTFVQVGELEDTMCGLSRPGHFRGVATVVAKLFNIVRPDRAYFGRKDAQQLVILQTMNRDLNFGVEIVDCEIVREPDGLAMSSRNRYLSATERRDALSLSKALNYARNKINDGERDAMKLMGEMAEIIEQHPSVEIDYIALVDARTLADLKTLEGDVLVAIAAKVGKTRLIDNVTFIAL